MRAALVLGALLFSASALAGTTLTLEQAMAQAEQQSLDLEVVRARAKQAEQLSARAWAGYLPNISISGTYTRNSVEAKFQTPTRYAIRDVGAPINGPEPELPGAPTNLLLVPAEFAELVIQPQNALSAVGQVNQALIVPALWPAIRAASFATDAAHSSAEAMRREVLFGVAQAYYGMATLQEALKVTERLAEVARAHEKDSQLKEQAGAASRLSRLRAELDRARAEQDVLRSKNALAAARLALAALLNRPADFEVAPPPEPQLPADLSSDSEKAVPEALAARPDVAAARSGAQAAESSQTSSYLKYLPSVGFNGRYQIANSAGFSGSNSVWALTFAASWTLWDGGLREAEVREASAKLVEARAQRALAERRASDEVVRARLDLDSAVASRLKAEESARLARESYQVAETAFKAGAGTYLEVTDANAAVSNAEVGLLTEKLNVQLSTLRLIKATGRFAAR